MRSYTHYDGDCERCGRTPTNHTLWVTDARPMITDELGVIEANPGEPKLCDPCEMDWRREVVRERKQREEQAS